MKKLFYQDPYIHSFSAKVISQQQDSDGNWVVVLDQTAFYPTGGGQPHDTGTINDIRVLNVEEVNGEILHYLESPLSDGLNEVTGLIDWQRRFDHMQQHAGQHILSASFEEVFGLETVSFHLGKEVSTIDLSVESLSDQQLTEVEKKVNEIILENRPIETKWLSVEEANKYPLRKKLTVSEQVRLVIIPEFDYNGCGGTHPSTTGQVGSLKILDWERQKKQVRVSFVCGNRVLTQFGQNQKVLMELSPLLNAPAKEMVTVVTRLLETMKEKDRLLEEAREQLLIFEASELVNDGKNINGYFLIGHIYQDRTIQELQKLARTVVTMSKEAIVILIAENDDRLQLVCTKGEMAQGSMKKLIGDLLPVINGKGGGNDMSAQGGGAATITGWELLQIAKEKLVV